MAETKKTVYVCNMCGFVSPKWNGKCPGCGEWNTMDEEIRENKPVKRASLRDDYNISTPVKLDEIEVADSHRMVTGLSELDRVFGGGIVKGSVSLIGGDPGIGKSTILLQLCQCLSNTKILYISGEESLSQLKLRAKRLGVHSDNLKLLTQTEISKIMTVIDKESPEIVIIDSIQTTYSAEISSIPGSISQLKECALRLTDYAKSKDITMMFVGHINKEGSIAGPKVLEHMVDVVLYFEGDKNLSCRILRAVKNRYGSTNEIGIFDMTSNGLECVENPSISLLSGKPTNVPGSCTVAIMEGSRPILSEVQALLLQVPYGNPRRTSNGIDPNRAAMLLAVIEKRAGLRVSSCDTFINVIGGLRFTEPSGDVAIVLSIASSFLDKPVHEGLTAVGEVGLAGELRSVPYIENRIDEAVRLGYKEFIVPHSATIKKRDGVKITACKNIAEAIDSAI